LQNHKYLFQLIDINAKAFGDIVEGFPKIFHGGAWDCCVCV